MEEDSLLPPLEPQIVVMGLGGCGCNTVTRIHDLDLKYSGLRTIAVNTDKKHLDQKTRADKKIVIGKKTCRGQGAGGLAHVGSESAEESLDEVMSIVGTPDMAILTCGLGGGTGTGSLPIFTSSLRKHGITTVVVVTLPFHDEGSQAVEVARLSLAETYTRADAVIVQANDYLLQLIRGLGRDLPFKVGYAKMDDKIVSMIKSIIELSTESGYQNVDFADIQGCFRDAGLCFVGEGIHEDSLWQASINALDDQFLDVNVKGARDAILHFSGRDIGTGEGLETVKQFGNEYAINHVRFGWTEVNLPVKRVLIMCSRTRSEILEDFIGRP